MADEKNFRIKTYEKPTVSCLYLEEQDILLNSVNNPYDDVWDNDSPTIPFEW